MVRLLAERHWACGLLFALLGFATLIELAMRWFVEPRESLRESDDVFCLEGSSRALWFP